MHVKQLLPLAVVLLAASSLPAHADDLFTLTNGTDTFSFSLPASPTPSDTGSSCDVNYTNSFCFLDMPIDLNGSTSTDSVIFYGSNDGGGLVIENTTENITDEYGDQLYSGALASPTFIPGSYALNDGGNTTAEYLGNFDLTISATPEPAPLLLLGTGLLGLAGLYRRNLGLHRS